MKLYENIGKFTGLVFLLFLMFSCSPISKISLAKSNQMKKLEVPANAKGDTVKIIVRPYEEIITEKAVTQIGLINVHKVADRYYFEIPDSILNNDILIVNRVIRAAAGYRPEWVGGAGGYGGDEIGERMIEFTKGPKDKIFIQQRSYLDVSRDSSQNGMYRSVMNSSLPAIIASFDIKAFSPDSSGSVIDVTDYLNGDNDIFFFSVSGKELYSLGGVQIDKSYIKSISSFPSNTEIRTIKTYTHNKELLTYELNSSIVLLPSKPMKPRYLDPRVGYFSRGYYDYDAAGGVNRQNMTYMIIRWRMEPRDEDVAKYKRGELVDPKNPIVYYIDPATPKKWVSYLIKGVNAWQKAFERAGFKNAIYAVEAPTNDSTWSLEDARHNAIIYKASTVENASGPQVSDPRSGEIIESHINWYHNVQQLLRDWYFIQASPSDPKARKIEFDESLMGQLIQYVCTHEVGHTLGLMHNFRASSTFPVDSLRSKTFLAKNGHTSSIMDYARFNYVAQPEDSIPEKDLIPKIGDYDEWAIEWGYKWLPGLKTKDEEENYLKKWIVQAFSEDRKLFYDGNPMSVDARSNAEDLGDDPIKAGYYGIKNLKVVMSHLIEWTKTQNKGYDDLARLNNVLINQYTLYIKHVLKYIGGEYQDEKTGDQPGPVWTFVSKEKQKAAINFLLDQLFSEPEWLFNKEIHHLTGQVNQLVVARLQSQIADYLNYNGIFNKKLYSQLIESKDETYSFNEMLTDLENGLWKELKLHEKITFSRRVLQKSYIDNLSWQIRLLKGTEIGRADYCTILNDHVNELYKKMNRAIPVYSDKETRLHLEDIRNVLKLTIDFQKENFMGLVGFTQKERSLDTRRDGNKNGLALKYIDKSGVDFVPPFIMPTGNCWSYNNWLNWEHEY